MSNIFSDNERRLIMVYGEHFITNESRHKVFRIYHSTVEPGKRVYRAHHHTAFEISTLIAGAGIYNIKPHEYNFHSGDVFVLSSDEEHCLTEITSREPLNLLNIQFEPIFIWSDSGSISDSNLLKIFFDRNKNFQNMLPHENPATQKIRNLILEIYEEFEKQDSEYLLMARIKLMSVLISLLRDFDYVNTGSSYEYKCENLTYLGNAINYINDSPEHPFTLDELADIAKMSRSRFCTMFKKYNGVTPWEYITIKRIDKSIELLKSTELTKLEIACLCGFNNTANFYRAFKKLTGKTPSDYAERH